MRTSTRKYKEADAAMLVAAATIIDNAITNKGFLQSKTDICDDTFLEGLQQDIDVAIKKYLGVNGSKALRKSTSLVMNNMRRANILLAEAKFQIEEAFEAEPDKKEEILQELGFTDHFKQAKNGNQDAMLEMLSTFAENIYGEIEQSVIEKDISSDYINEIKTLAEKLQATEQEDTKAGRLPVTQEGISAFNDIYDSVTGICKIAVKCFKDKPSLKHQFTFNKVIGSQSFKPLKTVSAFKVADERF